MESWKGESAELKYEMDSIEVRAVKFAHNPVEYLRSFCVDRKSAGYDEHDTVFKVIDEFESLVWVVAYNENQIENFSLSQYINSNDAYLQKKAFVELLKEVGIKKEHLIVWADVETEGVVSAQRLEDKSYRVAINEVYEEK